MREVSTRQIRLSTVRGLFTNGSQENRRNLAKDRSQREPFAVPAHALHYIAPNWATANNMEPPRWYWTGMSPRL